MLPRNATWWIADHAKVAYVGKSLRLSSHGVESKAKSPLELEVTTCDTRGTVNRLEESTLRSRQPRQELGMCINGRDFILSHKIMT